MTSHVSVFVLLVLFIGIQDVHLKAQPLQRTPPSKSSCECRETPMDIAFVLDSSSSISDSDFTEELWFVTDIVDKFEVSQDRTRVAAVSYGFEVYTQYAFGFDAYSDKTSVKRAVTSIKHMAGTRTETGEAVKYVQNNFLPSARPDVKTLTIVITDGNSQEGDKTARSAKSIRDAGIEVFAVGIGFNISDDELRNIAGKDDNVFRADNYDMLKTIRSRIVAAACGKDHGNDSSCYDMPLDISMVVDSSSSIYIKDFKMGLNFIKNFAASFDISARRVRFSLITYGRGTYDNTAFNFDNFTDQVSLENAITNTPHSAGDHTDTWQGIQFMRERQMLPKMRPKAAHIAIVITDGNSQEWQRTGEEAEKARRAGIKMYAIGVGGVNDDELKRIAGDEDHVFRADSYQDLETIKSALDLKVCDAVLGRFGFRET